MTWQLCSERDPRALAIVDGTGRFVAHGAHYSRRTPGVPRDGHGGFVGVGRSLVLLTDDAVWGVVLGQDPRGVLRWRNMMFRNLGAELSSSLIRAATVRTFAWWLRKYRELPSTPLRTEIDTRAVRGPHFGACYKAAGWVRCEGAPSSARRRPYMLYFTPGSRAM